MCSISLSRFVRTVLLFMICAASRPLVAQEFAAATPLPGSEALEEVVVTATKRAESLQAVPLSITALTGQDLESKEAVNFVDYARTVPNLTFTDLGAGRERVSIRGVDSKLGSTVVGYYLDETPIPDSSSVSAEKVAFDPELIDVDRVEVLRGPQGTTYGAGSMGGVVRIIPKRANPTHWEGAARTELSYTDNADGPTELFNGMLNAPIIPDRLALRAVGWVRQESGFVSKRVATPSSLAAYNATGAPLDFEKVATVPEGTAYGVRVALRYTPADWFDVEASYFYDSQLYRGFQDITTGALNPGDALQQNLYFNIPEQNRNRLSIANLKSTADLGFADLIASAAYTRRLLFLKEEATEALVYVGFTPPFNAVPITEEGRDISSSVELRLSSKRSDERGSDLFQWLVGIFYDYQKGWTNVDWRVPGFTTAFGSVVGPVVNDNLFTSHDVDYYKQQAVFGEFSVRPVNRLTLTGGVRWFKLSRLDSAPQNGLFAGTPNDGSILNPYAYPFIRGDTNNEAYKGVISWQQTKNLMLYAQAAEGFRTGFGRPALPTACLPQAQQLGNNGVAGEVAGDKLWNYEVGIKSDWFQNRLRANVAGYRIDWNNIQQSVFLDCGFPLELNLGSVRNTGAELEVEARPLEALTAGAAFGYIHSALQRDIFGIPGTMGKALPDVPQVTASAFVTYDFHAFAGWAGHIRGDYSYTDRSLSTYVANASFTPDKKAISLLGARLAFDHERWELALYGRNLLNDVERTALERDVSLNVAYRLRYSVNVPRTFGVSASYRF
ncbi:MAG: TonB-dependent receptor [Steroidobacteraceae bacterium]